VLETLVAFTVTTLGFLHSNLQHLTCGDMRGYVEILHRLVIRHSRQKDWKNPHSLASLVFGFELDPTQILIGKEIIL
jgi:hypothetical protein